MKYTYKPSGICARAIDIELDKNKIQKINIQGGCNGNGKTIAAILVGMDKDDAINRLSGITCGNKNTSCGDQLANALKIAE